IGVCVRRGAVLASMRRRAPRGEWRTNVSLGGHAEPYRLDAEAERLAIAAARAVGAEMAGVDLIPDLDRGHLVVLEVNAVPGWRALACVTGIDVAAAILAALRDWRWPTRSHGRRSLSFCSQQSVQPRPAGPARLPARSDRAQAGQRPPAQGLAGPALRRLPAERHRDRRTPGSGGRRRRRRHRLAGHRGD